MSKVSAVNFLSIVLVNLDNEKLSDADFRQFIRNTIPIVEKPPFDQNSTSETMQKVKKYYSES